MSRRLVRVGEQRAEIGGRPGRTRSSRCCQAAAETTEPTPTCAPCRPIGRSCASWYMSSMWLTRCSTPDRHAVVPEMPPAIPRIGQRPDQLLDRRRVAPGDGQAGHRVRPRPSAGDHVRGAGWKMSSRPRTEARYQSAGAVNSRAAPRRSRHVVSRSGACVIVVDVGERRRRPARRDGALHPVAQHHRDVVGVAVDRGRGLHHHQR